MSHTITTEDVEPLEVNRNETSIQSLLDNKRGVAFISSPLSEETKQSIKQNNLLSLKTSNRYGTFIVYKPESEKEARELFDIAEKHGGFLPINTTEAEIRRIGQLLNYSESSINAFVEKHRHRLSEVIKVPTQTKKFYKAIVKLSDLYVETDNMTDAYYKSKDGLGPGSMSTHKPLSVTKLLDGTLMLMNGHHRIADKIKYAELNNIEDILNLTFNAIVHDENYANLESVPDGQYWMSFMDWTYNMEEVLITEEIKVPIEIGDTVLGGKFKNKKIVVKKINKNEKGDLTINDKPLLRVRTIKQTVAEIVAEVMNEDQSSWDNTGYKKWKRANVTIRGMQELGQHNGVGSITLGAGLYSAALGNREMASKYGKVHFAVNAKPKHPLVFDSINRWEIWEQQFVYKTLGFTDMRDFGKVSSIEKELMKLGYDGVIIKGREMVNYTPENVMYFQNERQLMDYYENLKQ